MKKIKVMKNMIFYSFDIDVHPITFTLKLDLEMIIMYLHTSYSSSKVMAWTRTNRHRQTDDKYTNSKIKFTNKFTNKFQIF